MAEIPKDFRRRKRLRLDLSAELFEGAVIEAESEWEARDVFARQYSVKDTKGEHWQITPAEPGDEVGLYGPKKLRGLLRNSA